jgi:hypothetical protein
MVPATPHFLRDLARGSRPEDQEQYNEGKADEKQNLCNTGGRTRNAAETEHGGNQSDYGENQSPFEHRSLLAFAHSTGVESSAPSI